jgi:V8-like Glu-specific endopeptidase
MNDGVVCSGWAVNPNIIATAAHCVLARGHYSVSASDKTYQVMRI